MSFKQGLFIRLAERAKIAFLSVTSAKDLDAMEQAITDNQNSLGDKIDTSEKGAANGVMPLNSSGVADSQYLPSYVDDVVEYANLAAFPITGETGKIYVAIDTKKLYRWSGSAYFEVSVDLMEDTTSMGALINGSTAKATPIDADKIGYWDSITGLFKHLTWANLKAALKTYFDSRYASITTTYLEVSTTPTASQFALPSLALASISGNTTTNRFVIRILPGIYIDSLIDLSAKSYVSIVGASIQSVILHPLTGSQHMIKIGALNEVSFLSIEGVGSGFAAIAAINSGDYAQLHKVSTLDCDINILVEATSSDSILYAEYVDFNGAYSYGIKYVNSGGFRAYCNFENGYNLPTSGTPIGYFLSGSNAHLDLKATGNEQLGANGGTGIIIQDGGTLDAISCSFENWTIGISMPNIGTTPKAQFSGCSTKVNTTAISIQHVSGSGSFQGSMDNPVISIVSTATFGISYLERLLGNKMTVYYDPYSISPAAVTTPTAAAATTVVQSSVTGLVAIQFSGTADQNGSLNMRIPKDYLSGGRFKISWSSSSTSANSIKFAPILSVKALGDSLITQTETLTPQTIVAGTINVRQETAFFVPVTALVADQLLVLRVTRLATDAADTFTGAIFINGVTFEYNSSK